MNITDNLIRIKRAKTDIINSLKNKGVEIPDNTLINEIPTIIDNAEIGGGDTPSVPTELVQKYEGASVFRINVPTDNYEFTINLCNDATKATYDVDWGDGSLESGLTTDEQHHTYSKSGTYDVNIYNISKNITLGGSSNVSGLNNTIGLSFEASYLFNNTNNDFWGGSYIVKNDDICTDILIGKGITSIGSSAFKNCNSLQNIVIPEGVTSIKTSTFEYCKSLTSVSIPNSVTKIESSAFRSCYSLHSINISESVPSIESYVWNSCLTLQNIVIPEGVTSIGSYAFQNCLFLQNINISTSVTSIGNAAFSGTNCLQSITCLNPTAPTIQSSSFPTSSLRYSKRYLYVPKDSVGYNEEGSLWKTYLIDKGWELRYIEDRIKTPTTLKLKTKNNFFHNLQAIGQANLINYELINNEYIYNFDDKITELVLYTFYTNVLEEIELPESVKIIGSNVFNNSYYLQSITCKAMTAPTIQSNTFSSIGSKLPSGTPKILRIPQNSSGYEETTSEWYKQLISKGYTIEYIVPNTLNYTSYNGDVVTPYAKSFEGKNEIVSNVYENGKGTITFKEGLTEIYEGMYNKDVVSALTTIEIPNGVTRIGDYSFRSQYLTTLNVPDSVTYIGDSAFNGCTNLTEITLGSGVETIGQWAFSGCTKIATITCMAMVAPTLNQSFLSVGSNVSGDKILRVPQGAEGYDTWLSQLNGFELQYIN